MTLVGALSYQLIEYPTSKLRQLRGRDGRPRDYYPELTSTKTSGSTRMSGSTKKNRTEKS